MKKIVPKCPAILSVLGWHAGETPQTIVKRKSADIEKAGCTVWVYQSWKATVVDVQNFGRLHNNPTVYFLEGSARPATTELAAQRMSSDRTTWTPLPRGIGKVTGKLPGGGFFIGALSPDMDHEIDLWEYFEHPALAPLICGNTSNIQPWLP